MILSRTLARARIANGQRPSWIAAWGPVLADGLAIVGVLAVLWGPIMGWIATWQPSLGVTIAILFVLIYLPLQTVLILSSIWAVKSRWSDEV